MGTFWSRPPDDDDDDLILLEKRLRSPSSSKPSEFSWFHRTLIFLSIFLAFAIASVGFVVFVLPLLVPPPEPLVPCDPVDMAVKEIVVIELERLQLGLIPLPDWVDEVPSEEFPRIPEDVQSVMDGDDTVTRPFCSLVPEDNRFDCMPRGDVNQQNCEARGCCWLPSEKRGRRRDRRSAKGKEKGGVQMGVPSCFYPFDMPSYNLREYKETDNGFEGMLSRDPNATSVYPDLVPELHLQVFMESETRLRVKINDQKAGRYEVPIPVLPSPPATKPNNPAYIFQVTYLPFSFRVIRASTGSILFDTSATPLSFYNQFLEIASYLPSNYIYGLGEHTDHHFMHSTNWQSFTFWTTDLYPTFDAPLYGVHPFYLLMEEDGKSHGVFLFNSNAMDVILQPAPAITYRTVGGVLDFYFLLGPTADSVVQQYAELVGRPALPPYWALGYHLCRWGYLSLNGTKTVTDRNIAARIPFDTQWNDLDYMNGSRDFTIDPVNFAGLPEFVADLHSRGMHYVIITDPAISSVEPKGTYPPFDDALAMNCLTLNASGQYIEGNMWTGAKEAYPDYTCANVSTYFTKQVSEFHAKLPFDGLWIDMNEPSSFVNGSVYGCPNASSLEYPPYIPSLRVPLMAGRTLCMTATHNLGLHYNLHSTYGIFMAKATQTALVGTFPGKRPFILSRSTFAGQGQFSAHWNGDTTSDWSHMQTSVFDILNFNIFGIPFVGSDICGFMGDTTEEMCVRWHQLGAFYPLTRNHNDYGSKDQDPAAFSNATTTAIRQALIYRYLLLPYWNTLFFRATVSGSPVVRPVFFQFPDDRTTYSLDWQFLLGDSFMVSPVLTPDTTELLVYFPESRWYDFYTGAELEAKRSWQKLPAPLEKLNVHIRGGCIVPMQVPNVTTTLSRQNPFYLGVALNGSNAASGEFFWDDGEQWFDASTKSYSLVTFAMDNNVLVSHVVADAYAIAPPLKEIILLGFSEPTAVILDGNNVNFVYDQQTGKLVVGNLALNFLKEFKLEVKLSNSD